MLAHNQFVYLLLHTSLFTASIAPVKCSTPPCEEHYRMTAIVEQNILYHFCGLASKKSAAPVLSIGRI
jgi:hypothetical protein